MSPRKTHCFRCLKPYSPKPYSARFRQIWGREKLLESGGEISLIGPRGGLKSVRTRFGSFFGSFSAFFKPLFVSMKKIGRAISRRTLNRYTKRPLQDSTIFSPVLRWRHRHFTVQIRGFPDVFSNPQGGKSKAFAAGKCRLLYFVAVPESLSFVLQTCRPNNIGSPGVLDARTFG